MKIPTYFGMNGESVPANAVEITLQELVTPESLVGEVESAIAQWEDVNNLDQIDVLESLLDVTLNKVAAFWEVAPSAGASVNQQIIALLKEVDHLDEMFPYSQIEFLKKLQGETYSWEQFCDEQE